MMLSVQTLVPVTDKNQIMGLMGNYDDDISNDLVSSTGQIVCTPSEIDSDCDSKSQEIHSQFGESCKFFIIRYYT